MTVILVNQPRHWRAPTRDVQQSADVELVRLARSRTYNTSERTCHQLLHRRHLHVSIGIGRRSPPHRNTV
jgi:hypothetical protein